MVGQALGISKMAAQWRFIRLKKELQKTHGLLEPNGHSMEEEEVVDGARSSNTKDMPEEDIKVKPEPEENLDFSMDDEA